MTTSAKPAARPRAAVAAAAASWRRTPTCMTAIDCRTCKSGPARARRSSGVMAPTATFIMRSCAVMVVLRVCTSQVTLVYLCACAARLRHPEALAGGVQITITAYCPRNLCL